MLATMAGVLLTLTTTSATQWHDAWETAEGPVEIREAGDYTVWAWVYKGESPQISVDGLQIAFNDFRVDDDAAQWVAGDTIELSAGSVPVEANDGVASIVFTTKEDWDPTKVVPFFRVSDDPEGFRDDRVRKRKGTNTVFKMMKFDSLKHWEYLAEVWRRRILISSGLWPEPPKTPLNAKIFGRIQYDDYSVEKVYFEAVPGFLVTGNLYRPANPDGKVPGVACPHGHWEHGRLENGERGSVPARGITLARMGMVAFTYDMVGYNDSLQLTHKWESEEQKLWGIHPFGLQLLSSIRVLDFLETLPEVDPERLACTGASGGGTQTFALAAVDPRVKVAAPVNMISSTMQGGCVCENAPLIRLNNSNMEIGALMAPRPMLMISATGDWTKQTPEVEYPAIRSVYELYSAEENVENVHIDAPHNYNKQSREAMYRFFGKHLLGGDWDNFTEPPYESEEAEALRVFPDGELPEGYEKGDALIAELIEQRRSAVNAMLAKTWQDSDKEKRLAALHDTLHVGRPATTSVKGKLQSETQGDVFVRQTWAIHRRYGHERIPLQLFLPTGSSEIPAIEFMIGEDAGSTVFDIETGMYTDALRAKVSDGHAVAVVEPFWTGEHRTWNQGRERISTTEGFYDTFELTDTVRRVEDILTAITFASGQVVPDIPIVLNASGDAGMWALLAAAIDEHIVEVNTDWSTDMPEEDALWSRNYIPSIQTLGGLGAVQRLTTR